jgi:hypothetical protein
VSANEIGMKMRLENILDGCPVFFCPLQIRLDLPKGIDDGNFSLAFDIIRPLRQAAGIDLFYFHLLGFIPGKNTESLAFREIPEKD